jgi:excisionase family DNA binding protein
MEIITITVDTLRQLIREELAAALQQTATANTGADDVMTLGEVRDMLRVSDSTMRRMVRQREIPSFSVHSRIYLRRADVEVWVREQVEAV